MIELYQAMQGGDCYAAGLAIGVVNHKTTGVRVIPAPGCAAGDEVDFGGLLGRAPVMALKPFQRGQAGGAGGGHMPAPWSALRN